MQCHPIELRISPTRGPGWLLRKCAVVMMIINEQRDGGGGANFLPYVGVFAQIRLIWRSVIGPRDLQTGTRGVFQGSTGRKGRITGENSCFR